MAKVDRASKPPQAPKSVPKSAESADRRKFPRYEVGHPEVLTTLPKFKVVDLSTAGFGLNSSYPLRRGEVIRLMASGETWADAVVVGCRMHNPPVAFLDAEFRIGCRFVSANEGNKILAIVARYLKN